MDDLDPADRHPLELADQHPLPWRQARLRLRLRLRRSAAAVGHDHVSVALDEGDGIAAGKGVAVLVGLIDRDVELTSRVAEEVLLEEPAVVRLVAPDAHLERP